MNKDNDLKKDPHYNSDHLRERIDETIKQLRDETDEMDIPQAKTMRIIPVTGSRAGAHKYLNNKSKRLY